MKQPPLYPPLWFLLFVLLAVGLERTLDVHFDLGPPVRLLSWALISMGSLLALWARWMFLRADTTAHPFRDASQLLTHGAYRISRNPMYLGLLLMLIGLLLWLQNLGGLLLPPLFVLVVNRWHIKVEEQRLAERFGQTYRDYLRRTRRWL